jgi:hypothetical protein
LAVAPSRAGCLGDYFIGGLWAKTVMKGPKMAEIKGTVQTD